MSKDVQIGVIIAILGGVALKFITDFMDRRKFEDMSEQDQMLWEQDNLWN
jgi:hypothetical protein